MRRGLEVVLDEIVLVDDGRLEVLLDVTMLLNELLVLACKLIVVLDDTS